MIEVDKTEIAIVDDDESLCKAMSRLLRAAGYQPRSFSSAESFLEFSFSREPACLLLDIQLGGMSGFDLQRQLTLAGRTVPVIFITARDDEESREEAQRTGCASYLRKTDSGQSVLQAIRAAGNLNALDSAVC
jgi:FixJ family two-component response regulator